MADRLFPRDVERALVLGDMHGNLFAWERTVIAAVRKHRPDVIVQVGDFGYGWTCDFGHGWDDAYLNRLDELLGEEGIDCLWLDGNHENFTRLEAAGAFGSDEPTQTSERTLYLPRGFAWQWQGKRCMAVGGAYSVDKPYRKAGVSWWEQEELTDEDVARAKAHGKVDVVFAHDTFTGMRVPGIHADWKQDEFGALCKPNRDRLLDIVSNVEPHLYCHGHYHEGYATATDCWPANVVIGLNRESEPGSMIMLDFPSLKALRV